MIWSVSDADVMARWRWRRSTFFVMSSSVSFVDGSNGVKQGVAHCTSCADGGRVTFEKVVQVIPRVRYDSPAGKLHLCARFALDIPKIWIGRLCSAAQSVHHVECRRRSGVHVSPHLDVVTTRHDLVQHRLSARQGVGARRAHFEEQWSVLLRNRDCR